MVLWLVSSVGDHSGAAARYQPAPAAPSGFGSTLQPHTSGAGAERQGGKIRLEHWAGLILPLIKEQPSASTASTTRAQGRLPSRAASQLSKADCS